ncbi:uncharacterized protein LOC125316596 [Rhodamnia argentea]|uniref:Uncharacterized protein LOC125316596 n=1 Tax=Rhodamnia argentea TaxID=178133 RepID=A0ABM3HXI9_9MYRT|nr:uncharacterized protein LOC125316596 [Rhodamnia argentea]
MLSPRHHVIDVGHSETVRAAGTQPTADSTSAVDLLVRFSISGREQDQHGQDSVVENNADPTQDGGPPKFSISFVGLPDAQKTDTTRSCSMISKSHSHRVGFPGEILERCSWCKKKILENTDLYMYGYNLGVYCSVECRKKQMALDGYDVEDCAPRPDHHRR